VTSPHPKRSKIKQKKSKLYIIPANGSKKQTREIRPVMFNFLKSKTIKIMYRFVIVMIKNMNKKVI
jgi:hypothetical protein